MDLTPEERLTVANAMQSALYWAETDDIMAHRYERYKPIADKLGQRLRRPW
jgi:hypothetical protein